MSNLARWTGALILSLLAHAGAATLLEPPPEMAEVAGGSAMEVALIGNAFEETILAGDPSLPVDPVEEQAEAVEPLQPEASDAPIAEISPTQPDLPVETSNRTASVPADIVVPVEDIPPVTVAEAEFTATTAPVETVTPVEKPVQAAESKKQVVPEKPVDVQPEAKKKPEKKKVARKKSGDKGQAEASQKKGQADGAQTAKASSSSGKKGSIARQAGNAATSNYPGKVRSKLNRAFRYPAAAKREGLRGTAQVRFTVSANGRVSGVSIARSAGSPILDAAALEAVQRAAPFPKIPEGAGQASWTFTIPLAFGR